MNISELLKKRDYFLRHKARIDKSVLENYDTVFEIEYTHNSTAIEGNTLTLVETKLLLEDKLSIGGKMLREIFEVINHGKAFTFVRKCIAERKPLDESILKDIHAILMENIMVGGVYRDVSVYITGARHTPPPPTLAYQQIKVFYEDLVQKQAQLNPIEYAAWTHGEFVKIHPFVDGNGRTSRLIMNYQLMAAGFLPVSIAKEDRLSYFKALEAYAVEGDLTPFSDMIAVLEDALLDRYIDSIPNN